MVDRVAGVGMLRGSSPRVWGKYQDPAFIAPDDRFIPTRVGKFDKPCGSAKMGCGSSPRMWGKCRGEIYLARPLRFIPTRVGKMT